jgi:putative ABC transport system permease protein
MATTLTLKARRELTRRKARSLFTVATIAASVTGLWLFAVPPLIDDAMNARVDSDRLWDLRLSPNGVVLADSDIDAIRDLPNIAAVEARVLTNTTAWYAGAQSQVLLVGVDDFSDQEVNVVQLLEGDLPGPGQVLADPQNIRSGRLDAAIGDNLAIGGQPVVVSGIGTSLEWSARVDDDDPVFYLGLGRLQEAIDYPGISWIDLRVDDHSAAAMTAAADTVRDYLAGIDADISYWETLKIRAPGDWPEKEQVGNIVQLMYIIAALGLVSALFMVFTTMNTVVREQTREIGVIKAVGGPRRAIIRSYVLMAALLGAVGTALGVAAGIPLSNLIVGFAGREFSGIEPGFGVPLWVLVMSITVGMAATMAAALPAILRATRVPVRQALVDHGVVESFGSSTIEAALRRTRLLSRPARLGLRNAARHKGRTLTTALQIGFGVGTFLGFLALGISIMDINDETFDGEGGDIIVWLNADAGDTIAAVPGVALATPVVYSRAGVGGESYALQGQTPDAAHFRAELSDGRWFTENEESQAELVAVVGPAFANVVAVGVGDIMDVETTLEKVSVEVIGIDSLMINDGKTIFMPLSTTLRLTEETAPESYSVVVTDSDEAFVDTTAAAVQRALQTHRVDAVVEARYIEKQATQSQNRTIIAILIILGFPVIAIGMIGLVNTMTMNVIERTREIGVLRAIGARARHIRRMIRAEAIAVSVIGWLAAIPLGYLITTVLIKLLTNSFDVNFPVLFPLWPLPLALVATLLIAVVVVRPPVRRAVRLRPGVTLRYE